MPSSVLVQITSDECDASCKVPPTAGYAFASAGGAVTITGSVAARLGDDVLWNGLQRLRYERDSSGNSLVTFMTCSAAARLGDSLLWNGLQRLRYVHNISGKNLATP